MTNKQKALRIAETAWEVQPTFKHRFKTVEELADRILKGQRNSGTVGLFLPVVILEMYCAVDEMKNTLAHATLDAAMGESTVEREAVERARGMLAELEQIMPTFETHCGDWVNEHE